MLAGGAGAVNSFCTGGTVAITCSSAGTEKSNAICLNCFFIIGKGTLLYYQKRKVKTDVENFSLYSKGFVREGLTTKSH